MSTEDIGHLGDLVDSLSHRSHTIKVYQRAARSFCYACFDQNGKHVGGGTEILFTRENAIKQAKNFIDGIAN
ncbi:hypothetical protein NIES2101_37430 [Calothrix sp. HK-06]|nr:hypothetical protein NIES2101_37430 [Calothrix sp. HK-06]